MIYVDGDLGGNITDGHYSIANRNNTGVDGNAYTSIAAAVTAVAENGTIYVREGTYTALAQAGICFSIGKSVSIRAYQAEAVTLTYPPGDPPEHSAGEYGQIIKIANPAHVTLDGLTIIGTYDEGDSVSQDLDTNVLIDNGSRVTVRNCTFRKWGHTAIKFGTTAGDILIERNIFEAGGFTGRDHHIYVADGFSTHEAIIRHNVFEGASGYAVHLYTDPQHCKIYGNIMHGNGGVYIPSSGGGILLGGSNHVIVNNTIEQNIGYGGIVFYKDEGNNVVKNNIIRNTVTPAGDITADDMADNNDVGYNNTSTYWHGSWPDNYQPGGTDVDVDPEYAVTPQVLWSDYRLDDESPMLDAGTDVGAAYNALLDPEQLDWPTPAEQVGGRNIGAFA